MRHYRLSQPNAGAIAGDSVAVSRFFSVISQCRLRYSVRGFVHHTPSETIRIKLKLRNCSMVRCDMEGANPELEMNINKERCGLTQVSCARTHCPTNARST
ncbi:MAG: hypothetical protein RLZZ573_433 [Pseudomonadota bacterium]